MPLYKQNISNQIFLVDSETGEYYKSPDRWVSDTAEATAFENESQALAQRNQIARPKLELLVTNERGQPRFGVRLWKNGQG